MTRAEATRRAVEAAQETGVPHVVVLSRPFGPGYERYSAWRVSTFRAHPWKFAVPVAWAAPSK